MSESWGYGDDGNDSQERSVPGRRPAAKRHPMGKIVATYDYVDESGKLLFQVARDDKKDFYPRRLNVGRDPKEPEWLYGLGDAPRVLYRLPEVLAAVHFKHRIFIVEGEKDADAVASIGLPATTNPGGVGMGWTQMHADLIAGAASVTILPDNDEHGERHAAKVKALLHGRVGSVRILRLPDLPNKGDVSDWIKAGGTREQLEALASSGPTSRGWSDAADALATGVPETEWLVPNLISRPSLTMVSGDADAFKSWALTSLCLCAGNKLKWFRHFDVSAKRAMLVTADEDRTETLRKIGWLVKGAEIQLNDQHGKLLVWCDDLSFDDERSFTALREDVEDFHPDIIVVDHLRVCFDGDENSSEFARKIKLRGRELHRAYPCGVVWIHHVRKISKEKELNVARQRVRGTGGLVQAFDHHLAFERNEMGVGTVTIDRNKKGREMSPFCFDPRFADSEGLMVLEYKGDARYMAGTSQSPGEVLSILRSDPREWKTGEIIEAIHMPKNTVLRALKALENDRLVIAEGTGKNTSYAARETTEWSKTDPAPSHRPTTVPIEDNRYGD